MGVGVLRNGTKGVFVSVLEPMQGTENFPPSTFPFPRVVVWWIFFFRNVSYAFLFHIFLLSHGFLKDAQKGSRGGAEPLPPQGPSWCPCCPWPQEPHPLPLWVLPCFLTHHVLLAPLPPSRPALWFLL